MLTETQSTAFSKILEELGGTLDISKDQYEAAVRSYQFVGEWLAAKDSSLSPYKPEILPQGSFLLGTMIKPVGEEDELDVDLVCRLLGKQNHWSQWHLKQAVGDRIKQHGTLKRLLDEEGRRCWTLQYADEARFHLDILPAIVCDNFVVMLEKAFSANEIEDAQQLAIRITDKETSNYYTDKDTGFWLRSNPFGYALWFSDRATLDMQKAVLLSEGVKPVPRYTNKKLPLQRIVQILKRHRDIMFDGDDNKPISIIITTLAARAYQKQTDIALGLLDVVARMPSMIEERWDAELQRFIKWIANPVNPEENFADKWPDNPRKEANFYNWISKVSKDLQQAMGQQGLHRIQESLSAPFGREVVRKAFSNLGEQALIERERGSLKMASGTAMLGAAGRGFRQHTNHGRAE